MTMTTRKIKTATAILLTGLLLAACSGTQKINEAQEATAHFHDMRSAGQFEQIYAQSDDSFKKATTDADLKRFLSAMNSKLGVVKTSASNGWSLGFTPSGTSVTLRYTTQFEHGTGAETFLYRFANGRALLAGYHVSSNAFLTN
jgi:outer membrane murein-binding lipoprotein Lpp